MDQITKAQLAYEARLKSKYGKRKKGIEYDKKSIAPAMHMVGGKILIKKTKDYLRVGNMKGAVK